MDHDDSGTASPLRKFHEGEHGRDAEPTPVGAGTRRTGKEARTEKCAVILKLPIELWTNIAAFIPQYALRAFVLACRGFRDACASPPLCVSAHYFDEEIPETFSYAQWLLDNGCCLDLESIIRAARNGNVGSITWVCMHYKLTLEWCEPCTAAAEGGHLEALQYLHENGFYWDSSTYAAAAKGGHLKVLQWLLANRCPWNVQAYGEAAEEGHLKVLQWAYNIHSCVLSDPWMSSKAARGGHLKVLQWLRNEGCTWIDSILTYAIEGGNMKVLQWLRDNGCPWHTNACATAAKKGRLEVLQWLRSNGCPWGESTCALAALYGHLELLQWAHEHGCPWDKCTCMRAVHGGHLKVLQWLIEHDCPSDDRILATAVRHCTMARRKYLRDMSFLASDKQYE